MKTVKLLILFYLAGILFCPAQDLTQTIKGQITDEATGAPVAFANVYIKNSSPAVGTISDNEGNFSMMVAVGRYDIEFSFMGYEPVLLREIVVGSAKEVNLKIKMRESVVALDEIKIKPRTNKEAPLNSMAMVSARMLSVEEAQRYAGGFDDPARLASSFAGVASNLGNNGIVIRGNAPQMLSWRMEGVEIPNPNHFADMTTFGAGGLTALSSQMLANSDFYTGAFPAEYGNATSGVFDIFMRTGNNTEHEHTFQVGGIGIDISSEGPLKKGSQSSYLFNYRYSTLALLKPLLPADAEGTTFQDLAFKLNFPTQKAGVFSLWGLGLIDGSGTQVKEPEEWKYRQDREESDAKQFMGTTGLTHRYLLTNNTYVRSSLAFTSRGLDFFVDEMDNNQVLYERERIKFFDWNLVFSSYLNHKFGKMHTNRTGIIFTRLNYDMLLQNAEMPGNPVQTIADNSGHSLLLSAYSNSKLRFSQNLSATLGVHSQLFTLNNNYTIEPRLGFNWQVSNNQSIGIAYGKHSRMERLNTYFTLTENGNQINKNLDFIHAHHFILNYDLKIGENARLKVEPYYQILTDVPVEPGTYFSTINLHDEWFMNSKLENNGEGKNYGVDFTLERFLNRGYYYLVTTSLFQSKYKGGDDIWRNTRYNRNYLINLLAGKEWHLGSLKQNLLNINGRISYQGGDRFIPVDYEVSGDSGPVVYDYNRSFSESLDPTLFVHFTINFKRNKEKTASTWSLNVINATGVKEFYGFRRNLKTGEVEPEMEAIIIPNISYKIEF
nr:carboxypeptidase-like regulatory domain-containing protein [uncultured Draconibacterium sp.]